MGVLFQGSVENLAYKQLDALFIVHMKDSVFTMAENTNLHALSPLHYLTNDDAMICSWYYRLLYIIDCHNCRNGNNAACPNILTILSKILQCLSVGAVVDHSTLGEQSECVKELEDGIARLVD